MKYFLLLALLSAGTTTHACEHPIKFQVGSYFDSASVVSFWGEFANEIAEKLKCPTNLHPSPTYKEHLIRTLNGDGDIFVIPFIYASAFEDYQLKTVIQTTTHTKTYLVTNKTINPNNLKSLSGITIQLPSIYSAAYLSLKRKFERKGIFDQVNFDFGHSFQASAIDVVKNKVDGSIVLSPIFDALPKAIKDKVNYATINQGVETGGYLMVKSNASQKLMDAIRSAHPKIKILKWQATDTSMTVPQLSNDAKQQLLILSKDLDRTQNPKN